jgi:hypothetical protein
MKKFDIVLVLEYFRAAAPYLSIIKHLSSKYSIAIYQAPLDKDLLDKNSNAQKKFIQLCEDFGATAIGVEPVEATLLIIQQRPYTDETARVITNAIKAKERIGLMGFALFGIPLHDNFLKQFNIQKIFVINRRFSEFLINQRNAESTYEHLETVQVGLPFKKHPVFPEFNVDYLIASPTLFSFRNESHKNNFLECVHSILKDIQKGQLVAYKSHNSNHKDYFAPKGYSLIGKLLSVFPFCGQILSRLCRISHGKIENIIRKLYSSLLYSMIVKRATPMNQLTPFSDFALEAFLPGVRKGVIGGLSNTIWGTLYFGLPFYNCVDKSLRDKVSVENGEWQKDSTRLLDLNLKYFEVPFCHGDILKGSSGCGIIAEIDKEGDLLDSIEQELMEQR